MDKTPPVAVGHGTSLSAKNIWFGNLSSPVEVYFVSDWYCDYCRRVEPVVKSALSDIGAKAKYTWIDLAIHRESMNIIPVSLDVLLGDKKTTSRLVVYCTVSRQPARWCRLKLYRRLLFLRGSV